MSKDEYFMNYQEIKETGFRKPLFREQVVIRSLMSLRDINDQLLGLVEVKNRCNEESDLSKVMRNLIDLKINEITDELTLERINR